MLPEISNFFCLTRGDKISVHTKDAITPTFCFHRLRPHVTKYVTNKNGTFPVDTFFSCRGLWRYLCPVINITCLQTNKKSTFLTRKIMMASCVQKKETVSNKIFQGVHISYFVHTIFLGNKMNLLQKNDLSVHHRKYHFLSLFLPFSAANRNRCRDIILFKRKQGLL